MKSSINKFKVVIILISLSIASASGYYFYNQIERDNRFGKLFDLYKTKDSIDLVNLMPLVEVGHSKANFLLGEHYLRRGDTLRALTYFQNSFDEGEEIYGGWKVSVCQGIELQKQWWKNNFSKFVKQAENDDWYLQFNVAASIMNGGTQLTGSNDTALALRMMLKSAQHSYPKAIYNCALFYYYGWGTPINYRESFNWAKNGADLGNIRSLALLGKYYMEGIGTKQSKYRGLKYTNLAAERGNSDAQYALAKWYYEGVGGLSVDDTTSMKWAEKASKNGNSEATELIKEYKNKQKVKSQFKSSKYCTCEWCGKIFVATKRDELSQNIMDYVGSVIYSGLGMKYNSADFDCQPYCSQRCNVECSQYRHGR